MHKKSYVFLARSLQFFSIFEIKMSHNAFSFYKKRYIKMIAKCICHDILMQFLIYYFITLKKIIVRRLKLKMKSEGFHLNNA